MNKKKYLYILVCILMIFTLTGCFTKKTISNEKLKKIVKENDYEIKEDLKKHISAKDDITNAEINFYTYDNVKEAKEAFKINKKIISIMGVYEYKETSRTMINYSTYTFKNNTNYIYLSRVDNTLLLIMASDDDQDSVKKLVKELGY